MCTLFNYKNYTLTISHSLLPPELANEAVKCRSISSDINCAISGACAFICSTTLPSLEPSILNIIDIEPLSKCTFAPLVEPPPCIFSFSMTSLLSPVA